MIVKTFELLEATYINLVQQIKALEEQKEFLKNSIIVKFEKAGITREKGLLLVTGERVTIDDLQLKAALNKKQWSAITLEKVSAEKLDAAVRAGLVEAEVAEAAVTRKIVQSLRIC